MNTYDEGKDGEEALIHTREKIGSENKNKVFTEEEKANYLNDLRNKYKDQKSIEEQFAEAKLVPEKDKEHIVPALVIGGTLLIEYGPVVYNFLSNPQNFQWLQVLIDNPELFATKDAVTEFVEDVKDKGEKLEEAKEGQKQKESSESSQSPDLNGKKPKKDLLSKIKEKIYGSKRGSIDKKENKVNSLERTGSATKEDPYHAFNDIVDNYADKARKFEINNGELYQVEGSLNGVDGRFEWIVQDGKVTHRMFVPNGKITGIPIKP